MREKVHAQGDEWKMIDDDFSFRDSFCWDDPGLPLRNMGLIKELRSFEKCTQEKSAELEKEPESNKNLIIQERTMLESIQKKIRKLERQSFYFQLKF